MKKFLLSCFVVLLALTSYSQVQIDKSLNLSGANGDRKITNLETPVSGTDAANKDYVDAKVAAGGGSSLTMISAESSTTMTFGDAMRYCRNLTESGYSDWRLPTFTELTTLVSKGGTSVPADNSANNIWLADRAMASGTSSAYQYIQLIRLSDGSTTITTGGGLINARCVR